MVENNWTFSSALAQLECCEFQCEAGPLTGNVAFKFLERFAQEGPAYLLGQMVWFEIGAEVAGIPLKRWVKFSIVGCRMGSDVSGRTWSYDLSYDPPEAYHSGAVHYTHVPESKLLLWNPEDLARQGTSS